MKLNPSPKKTANIWLACLLTVVLPSSGLALPTEHGVAFPYSFISQRNVFDLKQPSSIEPIIERIVMPANCWLIGVRETLGSRSAVFSIEMTQQPGKPLVAGRQTLIVPEGETTGPIHVVRIANVRTGDMEIEFNGALLKISFKTHGEKLAATPAASPLAGVAAQTQHQTEQHLSRDAQIIMMEIERARTRDLVSRGQYPPLPPTPLTPTPPMPGQ